MTKISVFWIIYPVIAFALISCSFDGSETINDRYLNTEQYQSFKSQADAEIQQNIRRHKELRGYVEQLTDCNNVRRLSGTFTITRQQIDSLKTIIASSDTVCAISSTLNDVRFGLTAIGKTEVSDLKVLWMILDLQAAYEDYQLLAATFKEETMIDFGAIGIFKRNLSERLMSNVHIRKRGDSIEILSTTERMIKHPIEQNYSVEQKYRIGADGIVKQLQ